MARWRTRAGCYPGMKADTARVRFARAVGRLSEKLLAWNRGDFDEFVA